MPRRPLVGHVAHATDGAQEAQRAGDVGAHDRFESHVARAGELRHELVRGAVGADAASVDDDHARADGLDLGQDVRGEKHGVPATQGLDQAAHLEALDRVETAGRLVEDEHLGPRQQRHGEPRALTQPAREIPHEVAPSIRQAYLLQRLVDARRALSPGDRVEARLELEHLDDAVLAIQRDAFGQVADAPADLERVAQDVEAGDAHRAGTRRQVPGEDPHRGRLAGAVGPEETDDLPLRDLEGNVVERAQGAEGPREVGDGDQDGGQSSRWAVGLVARARHPIRGRSRARRVGREKEEDAGDLDLADEDAPASLGFPFGRMARRVPRERARRACPPGGPDAPPWIPGRAPPLAASIAAARALRCGRPDRVGVPVRRYGARDDLDTSPSARDAIGRACVEVVPGSVPSDRNATGSGPRLSGARESSRGRSAVLPGVPDPLAAPQVFTSKSASTGSSEPPERAPVVPLEAPAACGPPAAAPAPAP